MKKLFVLVPFMAVASMIYAETLEVTPIFLHGKEEAMIGEKITFDEVNFDTTTLETIADRITQRSNLFGSKLPKELPALFVQRFWGGVPPQDYYSPQFSSTPLKSLNLEKSRFYGREGKGLITAVMSPS